MLTLRTKDDIIIPFRSIGEPGWQEKTRMLLQTQAEEWGDILPISVSDEALERAEKRLGCLLPPALKTFYRAFGVADIGEELQAPENMEFLSVWAAGYDLEDMLDADERDVLPRLVTFSEYLGNGNALCFHTDSLAVYYFDHDTAPHVSLLFESVDAYLCGCLIKLQDVFFQPDINDAEDIVEDRLVELFDTKTIIKWLY